MNLLNTADPRYTPRKTPKGSVTPIRMGSGGASGGRTKASFARRIFVGLVTQRSGRQPSERLFDLRCVRAFSGPLIKGEVRVDSD
jgi:hypothetical protein